MANFYLKQGVWILQNELWHPQIRILAIKGLAAGGCCHEPADHDDESRYPTPYSGSTRSTRRISRIEKAALLVLACSRSEVDTAAMGMNYALVLDRTREFVITHQIHNRKRWPHLHLLLHLVMFSRRFMFCSKNGHQWIRVSVLCLRG